MNRSEYRSFLGALGARPKTRSKEELKLQCEVARWLEDHLPADVLWTASAAGARVGPTVANDLVASGVKGGWPDLQFLCADGLTRYIEIKTLTGSLESEQRTFRDHAQPHGIWAVCRTKDEVIAALIGWGVYSLAVAA